MSQFIVFISLLFLLFYSSRKLHQTLSRFLFSWVKKQKFVISLLAFLFFPGTLFHELSHFIFAKLLFVKTGKIILIPHLIKDKLILGSVEIEKKDLIRRFLIGSAPFIIGLALIFSIFHLAQTYNLWHSMSYSLILIYSLFQIGNTMFSSKKDMEGAMILLTCLLIILLLLIFLKIPVLEIIQNFFLQEKIRIILKNASWYLLYPLGINLLVITLLNLSFKFKK